MYNSSITGMPDNQGKTKRLQQALAVFAALLTHLSSLLMSSSSRSAKAHWNEAETPALINFLVEHQGEAGDGGNFKTSTFQKAATAIESLKTTGPPKTYKMCKTKWSAVSNISPLLQPCTNDNSRLERRTTLFKSIGRVREILGTNNWVPISLQREKQTPGVHICP